jgi:hypothetical protein
MVGTDCESTFFGLWVEIPVGLFGEMHNLANKRLSHLKESALDYFGAISFAPKYNLLTLNIMNYDVRFHFIL